MGLTEIALAGLGLVLVGGYSAKTGAGEGLSTLGAGVTSLIAAPGTGFGTGLQETAKGIFDIGAAIGSIGKGFGTWFEYLNPFTQGFPPAQPGGNGKLVPDSGGSGSDALPGGGGNVPKGPAPYLGIPGNGLLISAGIVKTLGSSIGPLTGTYAQLTSQFLGMGISASAVHSLLDPHFLAEGNNV